MSEVDQNVKMKFSVGASYKEVLESNEPILKHLSKGFELKIQTALVQNWKQEIVDMINNETARKVLPTILELAFDADIDIQFDDFEDLRENPMLQPLMASLPDLFESIAGKNLKSL